MYYVAYHDDEVSLSLLDVEYAKTPQHHGYLESL